MSNEGFDQRQSTGKGVNAWVWVGAKKKNSAKPSNDASSIHICWHKCCKHKESGKKDWGGWEDKENCGPRTTIGKESRASTDHGAKKIVRTYPWPRLGVCTLGARGRRV